jgi:hypothetical protein
VALTSEATLALPKPNWTIAVFFQVCLCIGNARKTNPALQLVIDTARATGEDMGFNPHQ